MARQTKYYRVPAGSTPDACRVAGCGHQLYMIETGNQHTDGRPKRMPVTCQGEAECKPPTATVDGVGISHFANCTTPATFRRK